MAEVACYCSSGLAYRQCCAPFHLGTALPPTALALMRSRFSAFCLQDSGYLLASWAAATRPSALDFSGLHQHWQRLAVIRCKLGAAQDTEGLVEFNAYFMEDGRDWVLNERSRFIKTDGRWFYLDGKVNVTAISDGLPEPAKNAACPCGSGKKFKRCCGAANARN